MRQGHQFIVDSLPGPLTMRALTDALATAGF
jgi:hypothetical protein